MIERWVVDASPLIALGSIGRLDLLSSLIVNCQDDVGARCSCPRRTRARQAFDVAEDGTNTGAEGS